MRRCRREGGEGFRHREEKRRYKEVCEEKNNELERWEKEVKEANTEEQIWKIVNRERKRRKVNEESEMREWNYNNIIEVYQVGQEGE